jgi:hypothetical protein
MKGSKVPQGNKDKLIHYFKNYLRGSDFKPETLNAIFYYSLFDYVQLADGAEKSETSRKQDEEFRALYPPSLINANINELKSLLRQTFPSNNRFLKNWDDFELNYVSSDVLSRIIVLSQLSSYGVQLDSSLSDANGQFDLELKKDKVAIELKRIWGWASFWDYIKKLCEKAETLIEQDKDNKFLFVVTSVYPPAVDAMFKRQRDIYRLNIYVQKVIKSHFVAERLLNHHLKTKNIIFIIEHIDKQGFKNCDLQSLCGEIKSKLEAW